MNDLVDPSGTRCAPNCYFLPEQRLLSLQSSEVEIPLVALNYYARNKRGQFGWAISLLSPFCLRLSLGCQSLSQTSQETPVSHLPNTKLQLGAIKALARLHSLDAEGNEFLLEGGKVREIQYSIR